MRVIARQCAGILTAIVKGRVMPLSMVCPRMGEEGGGGGGGKPTGI